MKKLILAAITIVCAGCSTEPIWQIDGEKVKIDNVVRVFMNNPNEYVIFTQVNDQIVPKTWKGAFTIYTDVKPGDPMYMYVTPYKNANPNQSRYSPTTSNVIELHIDKAVSIGAGQWEVQNPQKTIRTENGPIVPIR